MRANLLMCLGILVAVGCSESTLPAESALTDYRVLGVVADQPEAAPDATVTLTAVDFDPQGRAAGYVWSVCLYSLGSRAKFACADPSLELPLPATGPTAVLDLGPAGLDFQARFEAASPLVGLDGRVLTLEGGVDLVVGLTAGIPGQRATRIYKRVRVRSTDAPNQNPTATELAIEGELRAGAEVTLRVGLGDDTPETYVDGDETRTERLLISFYADAGELADRSPFDETAPDTTWQLPAEAGPAALFVAVRDGRGGLAVLRRDVDILP